LGLGGGNPVPSETQTQGHLKNTVILGLEVGFPRNEETGVQEERSLQQGFRKSWFFPQTEFPTWLRLTSMFVMASDKPEALKLAKTEMAEGTTIQARTGIQEAQYVHGRGGLNFRTLGGHAAVSQLTCLINFPVHCATS
jgi:hypothetical protein